MKKLLSTLIIVIAVTIGLQSCVSGCGNNHEEHRDVQGKVGDPSNCGYDFVHKRWGISYRTTTGEERQFIESDEVTCLAVIHNGGNFKVEKKKWSDGKVHDTVVPLHE